MIETRFKKTDIGLIPEDWEVVDLGRFADSFTGLTYSPDDVTDYGTLVLRSSNIQNEKLSFNDNVFVSCEVPDRAKVKDGDILICVRNGSARLVGKSVYIAKANNMAFGAFMTVLRTKGTVDKLYLNYYWKSNFLQNQINDNKGNIINQITGADIQRYKLILPTSEEQERIGKALSEVDELIDGLKKLVEKKRAIKQGAMSQLLTGKLRLPGFSEPWISVCLSDVSEYGNSSLPTSTFNDEDYVCTENMLSGLKGVIPYDGVIASFSVKSYVPFDILLSNIRPYLKKIWFADKSGGCSNDVLIIRPFHDQVYGQFLYQMLCQGSFFSYVMEGISGTKMPRGNKGQILKYELLLPQSIKEQRAIAKVLTDMDKEISDLEAKLKKYEQVKQGMMQQLLTGKIRLI